MSLGELTINDSILRVSPKQRASESFRRLPFPSSRRRSSALPPRRANHCIGILSLVFAVGVFVSNAALHFIGKVTMPNVSNSSGDVRKKIKAHFVNTKDAVSAILLHKHSQKRSSFIISYNYRRFWKRLLYVPLTPPVNGIPSRETIIAVVRHRRWMPRALAGDYGDVNKIRLPDCFRNHHSEYIDSRLPAYDRVWNLRS